MTTKTICLREDNPNITLDAYIPAPLDLGSPKPAIIVCPGGGYGFLSPNEGEPVALRFVSMGYNAFVLHYSVQANTPAEKLSWPEPLYDLASAVLSIREHAAEWNVDPAQLAVCGFSAGGHLTGMYASLWNSSVLKERFARPSEDFRINAALLIYPVSDFLCGPCLMDWRLMWEEEKPVECFNRFLFGTETPSEEELASKSTPHLVNDNTVPLFIAHAQDDSLVKVEGSLHLAEALRNHNIPFELHIFESGNHGFALADESSAGFDFELNPVVAEWTQFAGRWLKKYLTIHLADGSTAPYPVIAR